MSLETGTVLNDTYRVVRLLGKGAMGNVYLVEQLGDDKQFVVKELVFSPGVGPDPDTAWQIFKREATFMEKINHPGVPRVYGVFTQEGRNYLVMDYIAGDTLEVIINSSTSLDSESAIRWTIELCEILDYLHNSFEAPIVYRDMKPSNVIITPEGKAKLVDFGIARYYNPDKNTDTFSFGSPGYAAPEQYKGRGQSSPQTDVFALGVILYQMLTKYDPTLKPFTFPPVKTLNPGIPDGLENIVTRAIQLEPLKRYISIQEFKESLEKYIYNTTGKSSPFASKTKSGKKTNKWTMAGGILCVFSIFTCPFSFLLAFFGLIASITGQIKADRDSSISSSYCEVAVALNLIIILISLCIFPNFFKANSAGRLAACESNLKNIATALEMYATDFEGYYPPSLDYLVTPLDAIGGTTYMKVIPRCPCGQNIYHKFWFGTKDIPYTYTFHNSHLNFTLYCGCPGSHVETGMFPADECWPQYTPGDGIMLK